MLQLLQHLGNGQTQLAEVPAPGPRWGSLLIESRCSLVSAGTERMLVDFGKAGWLGKARKQPEKVRQVLAKVRAEGIRPTLQAIRSKLAQPIPLGYCSVGIVIDEGSSLNVHSSSGPIHSEPATKNQEPLAINSDAFRVGDRVVSNGPHAEVVSVVEALCCRIPDGVDDETATFTPLAAIALEGIDLLGPVSGDKVVVTGLGLIGQLAVRILVARGCDVLGLDPSSERRALAETAGAGTVAPGMEPVAAMLGWSDGHGVAGVLITASASTNEIVNQAARACRRRGRVVLVGVVGLLLNRADFYRNEVSFQVSNSYGLREGTGPGSVRANFTEVLGLMAAGKLRVADLITHRRAFTEAGTAYAALSDPRALGIILEYRERGEWSSFAKATEDSSRRFASGEEDGRAGENAENLKAERLKEEVGGGRRTAGLLNRTVVLREQLHGSGFIPQVSDIRPRIAIIGAGNFAVRTLLPAMRGLTQPPEIVAVASSQGAAAWLAAQEFGAGRATTDVSGVFDDPSIEAVFLTTRHDAHARQALAALRAGKHVWVEKPLCLNLEELSQIEAVLSSHSVLSGGGTKNQEPLTKNSASPTLMVGFNRRFSPLATALRDALRKREGEFRMRAVINAGQLPTDHWTLDPRKGGGRIVGEACHWLDLLRFLAEAPVCCVTCLRRDRDGQDGGRFELEFTNGARGVVDYRTDLPAHVPKESITVEGEGWSARIDNWKRLTTEGMGGLRAGSRWGGVPRKGHPEALRAFLDAGRTGVPPIPIEEISDISRLAVILQAMKESDVWAENHA
jgi:predicted dehydrogenase/threonine dehydrogenase-like Zn-dependent dehydrogenase